MAVASVALVVAGVMAMSQRPGEGPRTVLITREAAPVFGGTTFSAPPPQAVAPLPLPPMLALPAAASGVRLSAIPDALLNDPPAARFRLPIEVRGRTGLASVDRPMVIVWSEDGYWYELSSVRLTIPQLIDLASALE